MGCEVVRERMGSSGGRGEMIVQRARDGFYFLGRMSMGCLERLELTILPLFYEISFEETTLSER